MSAIVSQVVAKNDICRGSPSAAINENTLTRSAGEGLYEPVAPTSVHRRVSQDWG